MATIGTASHKPIHGHDRPLCFLPSGENYFLLQPRAGSSNTIVTTLTDPVQTHRDGFLCLCCPRGWNPGTRDEVADLPAMPIYPAWAVLHEFRIYSNSARVISSRSDRSANDRFSIKQRWNGSAASLICPMFRIASPPRSVRINQAWHRCPVGNRFSIQNPAWDTLARRWNSGWLISTSAQVQPGIAINRAFLARSREYLHKKLAYFNLSQTTRPARAKNTCWGEWSD